MDSSQVGLVGGVYAGADGRTQQQQNHVSSAPGMPIIPAVTTWQSNPINPSEVPQKTPISLLQECCTRKGLTPQYELLSTEGQVHEPTFVYRVTVNDMVATGQGKSKKLAKHLAAKGLLEQIVSANRYIEWAIPGRSHSEAMEYLQKLLPEQTGGKGGVRKDGSGVEGNEADGAGEKGPLVNPIGRLQEKCMRNRWPPPEYELLEECGQPHERTFVVSVKLGKFEEKGEAKSKKTAKRIVAEKMLVFLENLRKDKYDADEDGLAEQFKQSLRLLENTVKPLTALDVQRIEAFFSPIQRQPGEHLRGLRGRHKGGSPGAGGDQGMDLRDAPRFLARIGEEHNFRVTYVDIEQRREDGQYQCLVQLSTMPVAVCYGSGKTKDEAQFTAAHNALYYLKIMTKNEGIDM